MKLIILSILLLYSGVNAEETLLAKQIKCVKELIAATKIASNPRLVTSTDKINGECLKLEGGKQFLVISCVDAGWSSEPKKSDLLANFYNQTTLHYCIRPKYQWTCLSSGTADIRKAGAKYPQDVSVTINAFMDETIKKCQHGVDHIGSCAVEFFQKEVNNYKDITKVAGIVKGRFNECSRESMDLSIYDQQLKCVNRLIADTKVESSARLVTSTNLFHVNKTKIEAGLKFMDTAALDTLYSAEAKKSTQLIGFYNKYKPNMQWCIRPKYQWSCLQSSTGDVRNGAKTQPQEIGATANIFMDEVIKKCLRGKDFIGSCAVDIFGKEIKFYEDFSKVAAGIGGRIHEQCFKDKFETKTETPKAKPAKSEKPKLSPVKVTPPKPEKKTPPKCKNGKTMLKTNKIVVN